MVDWVEKIWYGGHPLGLVLAPLGWVYGVAARLRRHAYAQGIFKIQYLSAPVIVVGNICVGGTGKTPLVIWLANYFKARGYRPGLIGSGYRGRAERWPQRVMPDSDPTMVGDEAVVMARRSLCPVAVGPDRFAAARMLLEEAGCDLIISDDGLQHYQLARDLEIAVIDGERRHGNGRCLPTGPLREPPGRLGKVDLVVVNGIANSGEFSMKYNMLPPRSLLDESREQPLEQFKEAHAIAGIGNPGRFFSRLRDRGLRVIPHPFPDHHPFSPQDIHFGDGLPVLMTEKDAVKCRRFAGTEHWYIPIEAELPEAFEQSLLSLLKRKLDGREAA
jgi:tetraacyldisaccharide 4'-kinase